MRPLQWTPRAADVQWSGRSVQRNTPRSTCHGWHVPRTYRSLSREERRGCRSARWCQGLAWAFGSWDLGILGLEAGVGAMRRVRPGGGELPGLARLVTGPGSEAV